MLNEIKNAQVEHELQNLALWSKEDIDEKNLLDCLNSSDVTDELGQPIPDVDSFHESAVVLPISLDHEDDPDENIEKAYAEFGINTIDW
tara:strand:- start:263 stop:529 length:267 start_codon:yes stop_codon:yes gene_type:complete